MSYVETSVEGVTDFDSEVCGLSADFNLGPVQQDRMQGEIF